MWQEGRNVGHITSRLRAAIGAAMILACASPVTARAQRPLPPGRARAEAQWLGRRAAARRMGRWQVAARPRMALAWRSGYTRGWVAARHPMLAARWQRTWYPRAAARERLYGRYLERRRFPRMGRGRRWVL